MKIKRIIASFLALIFSLSMVHINVGAEEIVEKATDEKGKITVILKKEDDNAGLIKTAGGKILSLLQTVFNFALFPVKEFLRGALIFAGGAVAAAGFCCGGIYIISKINEDVKGGAKNPFKFVVMQFKEFKRSAGI